MDRLFTVDEARALMPEVRRRAADFITRRADLAELAAAVREGRSDKGGLAEVKAGEAWLAESLSWFTAQGIQVKGWAPLLVDFPCVLDGEDVLLCWIEGEPELAWYHRVDLGFPGRRPLPA